ncbi:unnamed protein product [marine sediment metagenome]|uniref:Uncharacterized protein n=1 Tax=marine sediment metagenome TaxID=412755 RepID=X0WDD3_9ZZZZ
MWARLPLLCSVCNDEIKRNEKVAFLGGFALHADKKYRCVGIYEKIVGDRSEKRNVMDVLNDVIRFRNGEITEKELDDRIGYFYQSIRKTFGM